MDFDLTPEERQYQQQVRNFIKANADAEVRWSLSYAGLVDTPARAAFIAKLKDAVWLN